MLDKSTTKKITEFVSQKPRTVQEISHLIKKNWRTAERYIERIAEEDGSITTRTFREGTRAALKIVFLNTKEQISSSEFQERLLKKIEAGRTKSDFSPFDVYQYVDPKKRSAFAEEQAGEYAKTDQDLFSLFRSAQKQVFMFSGNLSWANLRQEDKPVLKAIEELAERGVPIKILSRVDIASLNNISKVLEINSKLGKESIEIRHCEQPLRCLIVDNKLARLKEVKDPYNYKKGELAKKTCIFYEIYDEAWIEWLQKVFWYFFRSSISAGKRLEDLNTIQGLAK